MRHLLVYGGSFDPVHVGHLVTCRAAREALLAEKVLLVPARVSPFKEGTGAGGEDRVRMLELAVAGEAGFGVERFEVERTGKSYTVETLEYLAEREGSGTRLTLLVGADQLGKFAQWHRVERILELAEVAVMGRPGFELEAGMEAVRRATGGKARMKGVATPLIEVSSTEIRRRVGAMGVEGVRWMVPEEVARYIRERGLYRA